MHIQALLVALRCDGDVWALHQAHNAAYPPATPTSLLPYRLEGIDLLHFYECAPTPPWPWPQHTYPHIVPSRPGSPNPAGRPP